MDSCVTRVKADVDKDWKLDKCGVIDEPRFESFFSSRRRHTSWPRDWSSDVCSSDLGHPGGDRAAALPDRRVPAWRRGGHDPYRGARARLRPGRARAARTPRDGGARVLHEGRSRPRDRPARRHAHGRRRSARRRYRAGVLVRSRRPSGAGFAGATDPGGRFRKGGEAPLRAIAACLLALLTLAARPAEAAEWGLIVPGTTTMEIVRARYGQPTKSEPKKVDSYDTVQWVYEGAQAPVGMYRMTVDFGLLTANGYQKDVVRDFRLDAKPGAFNKKLVLDGWGDPSNDGKDGDFEIFLY